MVRGVITGNNGQILAGEDQYDLKAPSGNLPLEYQQPQGRLGRFIEAVKTGNDYEPQSRFGKFIKAMMEWSKGGDLSYNQSSQDSSAPPKPSSGRLGEMIKNRRENEEAKDPEGFAVAQAFNNTAQELGVSPEKLMEAVTTANSHVVSGQKSRALQEAAEMLGKKPEELVAAGRKHGFTMEDGKIIVDVDAARGSYKTSEAQPLRQPEDLAAVLAGVKHEWNVHKHDVAARPDGIAAASQAAQRSSEAFITA